MGTTSPIGNTDPTGKFTLIDIQVANTIRNILFDLTATVGGAALFSVESAIAGKSVEQAALEFLAGVIVGAVIGAALGVVVGMAFRWLTGKANSLIGKIANKFKGPRRGAGLPLGVKFSGAVHRGVPPQYVDSTWEINSFNISAIHRYSGSGRGALYAGTSRRTAIKEVASYADPNTRVFVQKHVDVDNVLDLTNPKVRDEIGISLDDLLQTTGNQDADFFLTNAIGDFARTRYNGMLVPSARDTGGANLIMFTDP